MILVADHQPHLIRKGFDVVDRKKSQISWPSLKETTMTKNNCHVTYLRHFPHTAPLALSIISRHWSQLPMELSLVGFLRFSSCKHKMHFHHSNSNVDHKLNNQHPYLQSRKFWRIDFQWLGKFIFITTKKQQKDVCNNIIIAKNG